MLFSIVKQAGRGVGAVGGLYVAASELGRLYRREPLYEGRSKVELLARASLLLSLVSSSAYWIKGGPTFARDPFQFHHLTSLPAALLGALPLLSVVTQGRREGIILTAALATLLSRPMLHGGHFAVRQIAWAVK